MKKIIASVLFVLSYTVTGYLNYGYTLGYFTHKYPYDNNAGISLIMGIGGPFAIPAVISGGGTKYWRTTPMTTEERWIEFHRTFPHLTREYFEESCN